MTHSAASKQNLIVSGLVLAALALLALIYYSPIWWVSLTAPNYPPEAFPDGVRIQFHMNGVFNGCKKVENVEITEEEALDCVHEMDTINHYVGMYPIAAGGPVERAYSQFLVAFLGVMLLGFVATSPKLRMTILGVGFGAIFLWMYLTLYTENGIALQNQGYIYALVNSLDQDASDKEAGAGDLDAGAALIARVKESLKASGIEVKTSEDEDKKHKLSQDDDKQRLLDSIRDTFEKGQQNQDPALREQWTGSAYQVMAWHYGKSLGRYFNNQEEIVPMVKTLKLAINVVFIGISAAMLFLLIATRRTGNLFYWLLVLVPLALPLFFVIEYAGWLWWFGHNLNEMGAFTVKPFMPTVFGQGKVAQFSTHSYPDRGFFLMLLFSVLLGAAALLRRRQLKEHH
ncbi:MAG TPA: hypothetical protein ENK40_05800 [Gammaproteobacteria bacterium]|nr:hypothetical protein [Gammaproteobacteria bacterium]